MSIGRRIAFLLAIAAATFGVYYFLLRAPQQAVPPVAGPNRSPSASPSGTAGDKDRPRPPLAVPWAISLPGSRGQAQLFVKPGHWSHLWIEAEAATADFRGLLTAELKADLQARDALPGPRIVHRRPVVLPKLEPRASELALFAPNIADQALDPSSGAASRPRGLPAESLLRTAQVQLSLAQGGVVDYESRVSVSALRDHQALLVVLSDRPDAYRFYGQLDFALAPHALSASSPEQQAHYRVVVADDPARAPLPSRFAGWTTTAVLVWDGYDAERLTEAQRQALVDWLYWGGRLVISGPGSLESLAAGFLAPYLPAMSRGSLELDDAALEPLDAWTIARGDAERATPWRGVELVAAPGARTIVAADGAPPLVVERSIGRGHIVVTAISLTQPELIDWPSYDAFVHGVLLGRPPRSWGTIDLFGTPTPVARWTDNTNWFEPRRTSDVALSARDAAGPLIRTEEPLVGPGRAALREIDPATTAARKLLQAESGLKIPDVGFVVSVVATYLVALVPINWLIFLRLGKPQWAWATAPLVAVGFSAYVIHAAELDIGFARSAQEIAVVELQPSYARAHVSRWGAIYNSLGDEYSFRTTDPTCCVLPLGPAAAGALVSDDAAASEGDVRTVLAGFRVDSNSNGSFRSEQIVEAGGAITVEQLADDRRLLRNGTKWTLNDIRIEGEFAATIDRLGPGESAELTTNSNQAADAGPRDELRRALVRRPDDTSRLTAWLDAVPGDLAVEPRPTQYRRAALVVAHLNYPTKPRERDRNLPER